MRRSHDVPAYGFERIIEPPPLQVDSARLLEEFAKGRLTVGEEWQATLAPASLETVIALSEEAGQVLEEALRADTPTTIDEAAFNMPDETWARVVFDMAVAHHARVLPLERLVAALVPLYFGRVASLIFETRALTTDQAEAFVERQARAFELAKPYFIERWNQVAPPQPARKAGAKR